jgi:hypothetical protein
MLDDNIEKLLEMFNDDKGFGDPDARRNAEIRLQAYIANQSLKTSRKLNMQTFFWFL